MPHDILGVKLEGGEQLLKDLRAAGGNVRKSLRAASKAGGEVIRQAADDAAPPTRYKKRVLAKASFPKKDVCEVTIKLSKKAWYLKFFETGATSHEIASARGALAFEGEVGLIVTKSVQHPGMPASPFMRPAFDEKGPEAEKKLGEVLRQAVVDARIAQAAAEESGD